VISNAITSRKLLSDSHIPQREKSPAGYSTKWQDTGSHSSGEQGQADQNREKIGCQAEEDSQMNIFDRFGFGKSILPKNATFRLTQEGREKLQSYTGTPQARILAALETCGTSDRDEIAAATGMSRGSVERNLITLLQKGYVQRVGGGGLGGSSMDSMEGDG